VSRLSIRTHIAGGYELLNIINNLKDKNRTIVNIQNDGSYFSWPEKKDGKKFLTSRKKYVELRDFFSLLFYNPKNFKKI